MVKGLAMLNVLPREAGAGKFDIIADVPGSDAKVPI